MTDINIAELRAIAKGATPGPRVVIYDPDDNHDSKPHPNWYVTFGEGFNASDTSLMNEADATFFATFNPEFCLGLLDKLEQLTGTCREALIVIAERNYEFPEDVMQELMAASQEWDSTNAPEANDD